MRDSELENPYSGFGKPCPAPFFEKNYWLAFGKLCNLMVYCHISKDLKECALWLISHGYAPGDICELFDISKKCYLMESKQSPLWICHPPT